jgi:SAM-dependent methyltransferase
VQGNAEKIPFEDNFFDLVVMEWVAEHLDNPRGSFSEIHRVLKPGGRVIFLTPNVWNYNVWIIRAIPNRFHAFFTRRLYNRGDGDTYPVRYLVNSARRVESVLGGIGFRRDRLILNGDPTYISFNDALFKLACFLERMLQLKALRFANVHLIGIYKK